MPKRKKKLENPPNESKQKWDAFHCILDEEERLFFPQPPEKSRSYYLSDTGLQQELLFTYSRITSMKSAKEWVDLNGSPIAYDRISYGKVAIPGKGLEWIDASEFLLESSASWRWYLELATAAMNEDAPFLEQRMSVFEIGRQFTAEEEKKIPFELAKVARFWSLWRGYAFRDSIYAVAFRRPMSPLFAGMSELRVPFHEFLKYDEATGPEYMSLLADFVDGGLLLTCEKSHWDDLDSRGTMVIILAKEYLRRILNHMLKGLTQTVDWDMELGKLRPEFTVSCPWNAMVLGLYSYLLERASHHNGPCPRCGSAILGRADKKHCGKWACAKWVQRKIQ